MNTGVTPPPVVTQPIQGEIQRYAGHPATSSLSPIFGQTSANGGAAQPADAALPASAKKGEAEAYAFTREGRNYDVNGGLVTRGVAAPAAAPAGPLPPVPQVQTASPMKPLAMRGMSGGSGQGMGGGAGGGRRLTPEEAAQGNYYAATRATTSPSLVITDGRQAGGMEKDLDASKAIAAAPTSSTQAEPPRMSVDKVVPAGGAKGFGS